MTKAEALAHAASVVSDGGRVIGIGSPRASLEANFALRAWLGPERFYVGMSDQDTHLSALIVDILRRGPARTPSLHDVEQPTPC